MKKWLENKSEEPNYRRWIYFNPYSKWSFQRSLAFMLFKFTFQEKCARVMNGIVNLRLQPLIIPNLLVSLQFNAFFKQFKWRVSFASRRIRRSHGKDPSKPRIRLLRPSRKSWDAMLIFWLFQPGFVLSWPSFGYVAMCGYVGGCVRRRKKDDFVGFVCFLIQKWLPSYQD